MFLDLVIFFFAVGKMHFFAVCFLRQKMSFLLGSQANIFVLSFAVSLSFFLV